MGRDKNHQALPLLLNKNCNAHGRPSIYQNKDPDSSAESPVHSQNANGLFFLESHLHHQIQRGDLV